GAARRSAARRAEAQKQARTGRAACWLGGSLFVCSRLGLPIPPVRLLSVSMRIGVYLALPGRPAVAGGAKRSAVTLPAALAEQHSVDFLHDPPAIDLEDFGAYCGLDLSKLTSRCIEPNDPQPLSQSVKPWVKYREAKAWNAWISKPYDL